MNKYVSLIKYYAVKRVCIFKTNTFLTCVSSVNLVQTNKGNPKLNTAFQTEFNRHLCEYQDHHSFFVINMVAE